MLFLSIKNLTLPLPKCDGVELRLDMLSKINKEEINTFCKKINLPIIFTLRKSTQGGHFNGIEEKRLKIIEDLLTINPTFLDLEYDTNHDFIKKIREKFPLIKIIISYHNFENTPENLEEILQSIETPLAYSYKIATMATSTLDALRMLLFVKNKKNLSAICMGEYGEITRILGPVFSTFIDYTYVEEPTALGQLSFKELIEIYHYNTLTPSTKLYGVIGDPVDKTLSYHAHNAVNAQWNSVYVKMRIKKEELFSFFQLAKKCNFSGLSVTMPLKEAVLPFLDVDDDAKKIGAVNTIKFQWEKILGYHTDGKGALDALEEKTKVKGKKIIILGAGGAARAIIFEALKRGANVTILNRTKGKAQMLAEIFGCLGDGLEALKDQNYDIIINTTPSPLPIDPKYFMPNAIAMDVKNRPKMTIFLQEAAKKGLSLVYGYEMFFNQAIEQCKIWDMPVGEKEFKTKGYEKVAKLL